MISDGVSEWVDSLRHISTIGYTVPFTLVHAGKYRTKEKLKIQTIQKLISNKSTNINTTQLQYSSVNTVCTTLNSLLIWKCKTRRITVWLCVFELFSFKFYNDCIKHTHIPFDISIDTKCQQSSEDYEQENEELQPKTHQTNMKSRTHNNPPKMSYIPKNCL